MFVYSFYSYTKRAEGSGTYTKDMRYGTYTKNDSTTTGQQQQDIHDVTDVYKNAKISDVCDVNDTPRGPKKSDFRIGA